MIWPLVPATHSFKKLALRQLHLANSRPCLEHNGETVVVHFLPDPVPYLVTRQLEKKGICKEREKCCLLHLISRSCV